MGSDAKDAEVEKLLSYSMFSLSFFKEDDIRRLEQGLGYSHYN